MAAAKKCTADFLPLQNKECADVIAATDINDQESLEAVMECFEEYMETNHAKSCVGRNLQADNVDTITEINVQ